MFPPRHDNPDVYMTECEANVAAYSYWKLSGALKIASWSGSSAYALILSRLGLSKERA